ARLRWAHRPADPARGAGSGALAGRDQHVGLGARRRSLGAPPVALRRLAARPLPLSLAQRLATLARADELRRSCQALASGAPPLPRALRPSRRAARAVDARMRARR